MAVPLFDIRTPLAPLQRRLVDAAARVIDAGSFVLGAEVEAFERDFAAFLGVGQVVGVANGTEAITIALRAMGVGPGDEVVVPSFTFYASAEAIPPTGARPVFCDVDPETMMLTPETVSAALTPSTKAVIAVHLFGNVAPVEEIEALGVPVLEDAAQATGSAAAARRTGALGTAATFSFYPTKNLGCLGDGGAVATDDPQIAERVRILRLHGSRDHETWELVGYNSRLDELQAAFLRVLLPELEQWVAARAQAATFYEQEGLGELVQLPRPTERATAAWHLFVIRAARIEEISSELDEQGIGNRAYYRRPVHEHPAMAPYAPAQGSLPGTDELARHHLAIPISSVFTREQAAEVTRCVAAAL